MTRRPPLKLLFLLATAALFSAMCIFLFNTRGPTLGTNRKVKEWYVSRFLLSGKHMVPPDHLDEAELRWSMATQLTERPGLAVMASSHGLLITRKTLPIPGLLNFSISGASMAEHWVTTELLRKRGVLPKVMLVYVDPWFFYEKIDWGLWHTRAEDLVAYETRLCFQDQRLKRTFGPRFSQERKNSLRNLYSMDLLLSYLDDIYGHLPFNAHEVANPDEAAFTVLCSDGGLQLNTERWKENGPPSRTLALRQFTMNIDPHRYGSFDVFDENLWNLFLAWLRDCRAQGCEIWIVFSPYNPVIYKEIVANPLNKLHMIETRTRQAAKDMGAKCFGAYDPAVQGFTEENFSDGDHLNGVGVAKLLAPAEAEWREKRR
jgi:hypothetical protein